MESNWYGQLLDWLDKGEGVSAYLKGNFYRSLADVLPLIERIQSCVPMKVLQLEGNSLNLEAATHVANALKTKRELKFALWAKVLSGMKKDDLAKNIPLYLLCEGVKVAGATLTRFDVSWNDLGEHGLLLLSPFLESPSCAGLQELNLSSSGLGPEGTEILCNSLSRNILTSKEFGGPVFGLKLLKIGKNLIKDQGAIVLSELLKEMTTLEEIHLQNNSIESEGMSALASGFASNPNLRVINLCENYLFWDAGLLEISKAIGNLKQLQVLAVSHCKLGLKGSQKIVSALLKTGQIKKLDLSGNEIGKEGALQLAGALGSFRKLEEVKLKDNGIGNEGRGALGDRLRPIFVRIDEDEEEQEFNELTEMQSFLEHPTETNYLLLSTSQPTFLVVGYLRNAILLHGGHFGKQCCDLAFKIISRLSFDNISERMADMATYLFSEAASSNDWSPNEMITYLMIKTSVFTPEDGAAPRGIIKLTPMHLFCLDKWMTQRPVPRDIAFYLSVIAQHTMRSRREILDLPVDVINTFQASMEDAHDYALQKDSQSTIPVSLR